LRTLKEILQNVTVTERIGSDEKNIHSIHFDSQTCVPDSVFVAVKGTRTDGHEYIGKAIEKGASVVVCENLPASKSAKVTLIRVKNSAMALGLLASAFYGNPSARLKLIGVTGTNGKTTIVNLLFNLVRELGYKAGMLSTIENRINDKRTEATHTTPDPVLLNQLLGRMVEEGCHYCFMEVSSHAIDQQRIAGLKFKGGIFTNITHDHLDYHKTFDAYLKAKKSFFDKISPSAFVLTNLDDRNGMVMLQNCRAVKYTYALKKPADFKGKIIENHFEGLNLSINEKELWSTLVGHFNAYNLLATAGCAILAGEREDEVLQALSMLKTVEGRFDYVRSATNITGIVDYAHTPDALKNVLETINSIRTMNESLITVFGAGGDRDRTKRPEMGKIAAKLSNKVILTSDNPRSESPEDIIYQIKSGVEPVNSNKVVAITDRKEAIKTACMLANPGDIILVAGKGHEKYQDANGTKVPFDDKEILIGFLSMKTNIN
jgi:UDP-N-acetylmuramoyl-L-alanyl-D-glutamate--2,6-diaminopimelate ligase